MVSRFFLPFILLGTVYAKPLFKHENKEIYGCFNQISTEKEKSSTLILRNSSLISKDLIVNEKSNKNSVLVVRKYESRIRNSFEVSPIKQEALGEYYNQLDGWTPKLPAKTIFTSRDALKAFSLQAPRDGFYHARYIEFAGKENDLVCSTDEKVIKAFFFKMTVSE